MKCLSCGRTLGQFNARACACSDMGLQCLCAVCGSEFHTTEGHDPYTHGTSADRIAFLDGWSAQRTTGNVTSRPQEDPQLAKMWDTGFNEAREGKPGRQ